MGWLCKIRKMKLSYIVKCRNITPSVSLGEVVDLEVGNLFPPESEEEIQADDTQRQIQSYIWQSHFPKDKYWPHNSQLERKCIRIPRQSQWRTQGKLIWKYGEVPLNGNHISGRVHVVFETKTKTNKALPTLNKANNQLHWLELRHAVLLQHSIFPYRLLLKRMCLIGFNGFNLSFTNFT